MKERNPFTYFVNELVKLKTEEKFFSVKPASKNINIQPCLDEISQLRGRPMFYPYVGTGRGSGSYVELLDGSVKIDFTSGIGVHILGHCHPEVMKASLQGALEDVVMQGHLQVNEIYQKVLKKLVSIASRNSRLSQAWISPSGSMANENAIKTIRQKQGARPLVLAFEGAFAGRTTFLLDITDNPKVKQGLSSHNEVLRVPFCFDNPDRALQVLKQHVETHKDKISCFIFEFMQGDGGYRTASARFFLPLIQFCKEQGIAIWADEIQTFLRSGEFFAFEKLGLGEYIDVCTVGKSLQLSACLWTKEFNPKPGLVSGTFASSSSSLHSALAILNEMESFVGKKKRVEKLHEELVLRLKKLEAKKLISDIDGWGVMVGMKVLDGSEKTTHELLHLLFKKGLIVFSCGNSFNKRVRLLPPACLSIEELDEACKLLEEGLLEMQSR